MASGFRFKVLDLTTLTMCASLAESRIPHCWCPSNMLFAQEGTLRCFGSSFRSAYLRGKMSCFYEDPEGAFEARKFTPQALQR